MFGKKYIYFVKKKATDQWQALVSNLVLKIRTETTYASSHQKIIIVKIVKIKYTKKECQSPSIFITFFMS